jgi:hypothetical protein
MGIEEVLKDAGSFVAGAAIWYATAFMPTYGLGAEKANRLPGGAFSCGVASSMASRRLWQIPLTVASALCGHFTMVWLSHKGML